MSRHGRGRGGFSFGEGDWTCPGCGNVNFARRSECNRCGEEKKINVKKIKKGGVQIGKAAAEKSKGLFSPDDWICKTCGNVNWARRSDCNICNTPKVGVQEERTGLGGGFNERDNVEYKRREDSDDEYDQYGRKKRKKSQNGAAKVKEVRKVESDHESEEDDDDDDDEDVDLSKYDLDDDNDEDEGDASKYDLDGSDDDSSRSSSSRSRSRSPHKRRHSRSSSSEDERRSSSHKKYRKRSRSRSRSAERRRR